MKPTFNKALSCTVLNHNYIKTKANPDQSFELTCSQCGAVINSNEIKNFEESEIDNKAILSKLRHLFYLKLQISKSKLS